MVKIQNRSVAKADRRTVRPREKVKDEVYADPRHVEWSSNVLKRAGFKCEDCSATGVRLHADHIVEIEDGGARFDPGNGRSRCSSCHGLKTARERAKRAAASLVRT